MSEQWRPIPGSPGYEVSSEGRIRSPRKVLKPARHYTGYLLVSLTRSRGSQRVHRLVASAFLGDPSGLDVDHVNGVRDDNRLVNLRIVTHAENMRSIRERMTHCRRGHSMADAYVAPKTGFHNCRRCRQLAEGRRQRGREKSDA